MLWETSGTVSVKEIINAGVFCAARMLFTLSLNPHV